MTDDRFRRSVTFFSYQWDGLFPMRPEVLSYLAPNMPTVGALCVTRKSMSMLVSPDDCHAIPQLERGLERFLTKDEPASPKPKIAVMPGQCCAVAQSMQASAGDMLTVSSFILRTWPMIVDCHWDFELRTERDRREARIMPGEGLLSLGIAFSTYGRCYANEYAPVICNQIERMMTTYASDMDAREFLALKSMRMRALGLL